MTLNTIIRQTITNYLNDNPYVTVEDIVEYTECDIIIVDSILCDLFLHDIIEKRVGYIVKKDI